MGELSGQFLLPTIKEPKDLKKLSDAELKQLAIELRNEVVSVVSQTGGHLGSSLGVVELTIAIHAVFNTPFDKLIWDVGHQCYPHKILTGRREQMRSLRQEGGLSGFTKRMESPYDPFGAAHSSTSISAALGFATGRDLGGDVGDAIAVIGDGAMSAGMAFEAMNNAGAEGRRMFVILNDNEMSIAPPVGALSRYLSIINRGPLSQGSPDLEAYLPSEYRDGLRRAQDIIRPLLGGQGTLFEDLGFEYLGPVDGHDLDMLLPMLRAARVSASKPLLIHVCTVKGKGYEPAERSGDCYHGVATFDVATGKQNKSKGNSPQYTAVFGHALTQEANEDPKVVGITAAMPSGCGLDIMQKVLPERVFDVGIAEQHAVTFAAGLAASGMKPFCAIYSTFLQRAYDQIVHDVALQNLPVRFALDRAGLVGADGATHAGSFDIGYLGSLPNMVVMAAADEAELLHMVRTSVAYDEGPMAFRFPRGEGVGVDLPERGEILSIGKGRVVREGADVALVSFGAHLHDCLEAREALLHHGVSCTVVDARFAKPLDIDLLCQMVSHHRLMVTIEQGAMGGFGAMVLQTLANLGELDGRCQFRTMHLPDRFIDQASPAAMYRDAGLSVADITKTVLSVVK